LAHAGASNDVVSIDFKGWFRTRDGQRIDPLTVVDNSQPLRFVLPSGRQVRRRARAGRDGDNVP